MIGSTNADLYGFTTINGADGVTVQSHSETNEVTIGYQMPDGAVTEPKLGSKSVTSSKIDDNAVGYNQLSSDVVTDIQNAQNPEFVQGENIQITTSGNTVRISGTIDDNSIDENKLTDALRSKIDSAGTALSAGDNVSISEGRINADAYATGRVAYKSTASVNSPNLIEDGAYDVVNGFSLSIPKGTDVSTYQLAPGTVLIIGKNQSTNYTVGCAIGNMVDCTGIIFKNKIANDYSDWEIIELQDLLTLGEDLVDDVIRTVESELAKKQDKPLVMRNVEITSSSVLGVRCNFVDGPNTSIGSGLDQEDGYGVILGNIIPMNIYDSIRWSGVVLNIKNCSDELMDGLIYVRTPSPMETPNLIGPAAIYAAANEALIFSIEQPGGYSYESSSDNSDFGIIYVPNNPDDPYPDFSISKVTLLYTDGTAHIHEVEIGSNNGLGTSQVVVDYNAAEIETQTDNCWIEDSEYSQFPWRADVSFEGVTQDMIITAGFSISDMMSGNYAPFYLPSENSVRFYAKVNDNITLDYIKAEEL